MTDSVKPITAKRRRQVVKLMREVRAASPTVEAELNGEEAIAGFLGWLTTRPASVTLGASHVMPSDLVKRFYECNKVSAARDGWDDHLTHPAEKE